MPGPLRYWHLASLDAPTVAVVWAWAFAWVAHVRLAVWPLALLGLVVWAVYVSDRLLDARTGLHNPRRHDLRERHHFHWRHRHVLAPLAALAGVAAAWIVRWRVPLIALPQDSAVAVATLAYFSSVHTRLKLPAPVGRLLAVFGSRECLVGVLFAAGCVLPAWSMDPVWNGLSSPFRLLALPVVYFSALAWLNVRAISHWESAASRRGGFRLGRIACGLAIAGLALAVWVLQAQPRTAALMTAGAVSALLIGWLDRRQTLSNSASQRVSESASQQAGESALMSLDPLTLRIAVDLVLLTPLLLLAAPLV